MHGVLQDYIEAHMWFNLAATQDNEISVRTCDLAEEMTREHIATPQFGRGLPRTTADDSCWPQRAASGVAQDSDAFGSGRVGDPCRPFCNGPF